MEGKVVVITGASKGIGKAIKIQLEKEGYIIINISRTSGFDLMKSRDLEKAGNIVKHADILINNVGGMGNCEFKDFVDCIKKNLLVTMYLTEQFLKVKKKGRVITISSIYGKEKGHNPWFTAAKAGQIAFMKTLAGTYKNITFNTICPGHIDVGKPFLHKTKYLGKPEDVASLVSFICSEKAKYINGACITVDGGESHSL